MRVQLYCPQEDYFKLKSKLALKGVGVSAWFREAVKKFVKP